MASTPRVALFPSAFAPHVGGVEELTRQLGLELARRGPPPLVLTNRYPTDLPRRERLDGLDVVRERFSVPLPSPRPLVGYALHSVPTRRRVWRALRTHGTQVMHVQCVSYQSRYVLEVRRRTRLPLVVSLQGELTMDANQVYQRTPLLRRLWRRLLDEADVITACSAYVLAEAEDFYARDFGERGLVVPNGVALQGTVGVTPHPHPRPYVLGLGRLVEQKGFDLLIEAFAKLASRRGDVDLLVAGDGPERVALRALAVRHGLGERVYFLGAQPHRRALALFKGASAFVLASRHEPQGIVVLEAMAMGAPLIAARVGGVPEVVQDGRNGLLFPGGDATALSKRLGEALTDSAGAASRARAASTTVRAFDWPLIADKYLLCYQRAMVGR